MWFFMNSCYLLTALSFGMLILSGAQGYFPFKILNANHATFALLATIIYLFTETLVMFFFVGIGMSIKEYSQERKLGNEFTRQSFAIKMKLYPPLLLNMSLVSILFISGGAVDTGHLKGWIHGLFYWVCLLHFLYTIKIQHESFKATTEAVLKMSKINSC